MEVVLQRVINIDQVHVLQVTQQVVVLLLLVQLQIELFEPRRELRAESTLAGGTIHKRMVPLKKDKFDFVRYYLIFSYLLFNNNVPASTMFANIPKDALVSVSVESNAIADVLNLFNLSSVTHPGACGGLGPFSILSKFDSILDISIFTAV